MDSKEKLSIDIIEYLEGRVRMQRSSRYCSTLTTVEIYFPLNKFEELNKINDDDVNAIISAFHVLYPVRDNDIEICGVDFFDVRTAYLDPIIRILFLWVLQVSQVLHRAQ